MCSQLLAEVERSVSRIFDDRENTAAYNRQHCVMGAYTCQLSCCRPDQHSRKTKNADDLQPLTARGVCDGTRRLLV